MPVDPDKLLSFAIPIGRQTVSPRDAAFYALSVGMGRDPLDQRQLPFVDPLAGPAVMPAIALVLAHPGFWLADPASGVDPASVLHAAQSLEILAPIPTSGEVESQTRVTRLVDKGEGKPALIYTTTDLQDSSGVTFARLDRTTFIRGGGGFGGSSDSGEGPSAPDPQEGPDFVVDLTTGAEQALLYRLNGDYNPLHSDPDTAKKAGFDRPILHGLCTMGVITHALLRTLADYDSAAIRSVSLRFSNPVYPGETIRTEIWRDGRFRASVPERGVFVAAQGQCRLASSL